MDSERSRTYQAMSHLTTCRKSLEDNAEAVKASIRQSVERQIEALRSREQWLVQQVELVKCEQAEKLRRQERCLQQALSPEPQSRQQSAPMSLLPAEPPLVSFSAESAALHEMISQYGRVVCGYAQSPSVTSSLPGPVEEYEDKDEGWEHKSLACDPYLVRIPRTPPRLQQQQSQYQQHYQQYQQQQQQQQQWTSSPPGSVSSFEVLGSVSAVDEDKTRWLINYVCKANEPCQTKEDCLCDGGCFKKLDLEAGEKETEAKIKIELDGNSGGGGNNPNEKWLCKYQPKVNRNSPAVHELKLANWRNLRKEDWLNNN